MKLNGWQRLWVVTAVLWTLPIVVMSYVNWPTAARVSNIEVYPRMNPANIERLFGEGLPIEDTKPLAGERLWPTLEIDGHVLRFLGSVSDTDMSRTAGDYQAALRHVVVVKRAAFAGEVFALWVIPGAAVYALGWAVAWVRHGFAGSSSTR